MKRKCLFLSLAMVAAISLVACGGPKLTEITLPEAPLELATGETAILKPGYTYDGETPENAQPEVRYTSSDESVATVAEDGTVTGVAEGEAAITAAVGELSAEQRVVIVIPVESLAAEDLSLRMADGAAQLVYTVVPDHFTGELTFVSADEAIATVEADGLVTPMAVGETTVTITAPNGKTATASVEIWDGPQELTLTAGKTEVTQGNGTQISVTDEAGNEIDAESLSWASSDENIAVVTDGWVDMIGTGEVTITADAGHGVSANVTLTGITAKSNSGNNIVASAGSGNQSGSSTGTVSGGAAPSATGEGHGYWTVYGDGTALSLINGIRAGVGAGSLTWDDGLGDIAAARCRELMDDFSHNGQRTGGEVCAVGHGDASSVVSAWQGSDAHYANMVYSGFTRGAVAHTYDGDGCHYWCAVFD